MGGGGDDLCSPGGIKQAPVFTRSICTCVGILFLANVGGIIHKDTKPLTWLSHLILPSFFMPLHADLMYTVKEAIYSSITRLLLLVVCRNNNVLAQY
jgi:hypothetical protein